MQSTFPALGVETSMFLRFTDDPLYDRVQLCPLADAAYTSGQATALSRIYLRPESFWSTHSRNL
jgi:hypothetical protein